MIQMITKEQLMALGFSKGTSQNIIRRGKQVLVERGFEVYNNKRIGAVPTAIIEELLGVTFDEGV